MLDFGQPELSRLSTYGAHHHLRLSTPWRLDLTDSLLELAIGCLHNEQHVVYVRPGIVLALVPTLRALLECLIVSLFVLFDEALQADVAAYFVTKVITLEKEQQ